MRSAGVGLLATGLFLWQAASASAQTYDPSTFTAAQILSRADAASGALQDGAYKRVTRSHTGGIDTMSTTYLSGDDWMRTSTSGGFTSASGSYRGQVWEQDENGVVNLTSNFRSKVDPNTLAWEHPDNPAYRVRVLGITQSAPREYVIEANPPGGTDRFRYYDAGTFLLDRKVRFSTDRYRHVTEYSDYRSVFGAKTAFHIHSYDGRPQNDFVSQTLSFEKTAPQTLAIPQSKPIYSFPGSAPVVLPCRFTPAGIIVRATVNGRGLDFLLDSGASGLFIDPGAAAGLGLSAYGRQSETIGGGDVDMGRIRIPQMQIGTLQLQNVVFTTSPYHEEADGSLLVGLMGFDLLASAVTEIDFRAETVTAYPDAQFDPKELGLVPVPLQTDDGIPRASASIEDVPGAFLVDTGATGTLVYENYARKLPSAPLLSDDYRIGTVGGTMNAQLHAVTDLRFGGILFRSANVIVPSSSTFDISDYDAVLGRDALAAYRLYFDYPHQMLYVKPNV